MQSQARMDAEEMVVQTEIACMRSAIWANYAKAVMFLLFGLAAFSAVPHIARVAKILAGAP